MMINFKKLIPGFIKNIFIQNNSDGKRKEDPDELAFKELIHYFVKEEEEDFPIAFIHKDKYFKEGHKIYKAIELKNYIKEIRIVNSLDDAAAYTKLDIKNNKLEIIILIASIELGIGSGGGISNFTQQQCERFIDTLAHELFHAKNNIDIVNNIGIEEYKSIRYSKKIWTKIAWNIFDEYCAYRKNAEQFGSLKSVESVSKIENLLSFIQDQHKGSKKLDSSLIYYIREMLYSIATISAFSDVSKIKEKEFLEEANESKEIIQEVRHLFNNFYQNIPLNSEDYNNIGHSLEQIYNSYIYKEDKYIN